jgi:hypothetical protein
MGGEGRIMVDDAFDPTETGAETNDDAGDDEAVDDGGLVGAADTDNESTNASDDEHGIVGEEA